MRHVAHPNALFNFPNAPMKNLAACSLTLLTFLFMGCASTGANHSTAQKDMSGVKLMVLYPQPTDIEQFEKDYRDHLKLLHEKANIPDDAPRPYTVTKFLPTPDGPAPYYQLFTLPYPSMEALQQARGNLQEVATDAVRISSGGPPVVLIGSTAPEL